MENAGVPVTVDAAVKGQKTGVFAWLSNAGILKLNAILLLSLISSYATGFDGSMMNGLQSLESWKASFNHPEADDLALLNAIQSVGQLVALPFCAYICDRFGRKPALLISAAIMLVGVALQGGAQNTGMFIAARGIIGLGLALNITPSARALVSIYNSLWGVGALVAAWATYGTFRIESTWAWRIPSLLQAFSSVLQLALCFLIEESPRWLISKERDAEAERLLIKYHADGDAAHPLVPLEMAEIRTALRLENEALASTSYLSFFKTAGNRRRFFIILAVGFFSQWSGNGLISYYLTLILNSIGYKDQETQTLINGLLTLWGTVWSLAFSLIVNRFGRRTLFLVSTIGSLMVYIVWTALEATYEKAVDVAGDGEGGPDGVTYVVEILPFNLRARGLVLYNLFVALALIFNQYANPIGVTNSGWKYYITYDVWLAFEALVVYFLFVETGKLSLEETAAVLDGEDRERRLEEEVIRNTEKTLGLTTVETYHSGKGQ
ncbi:hypothetical protein PG997_008855 [Apiospora hydei]|uniref:Major facilitator superfamily (MFS) profile domain-containing protein n=1 Tax=Apiospora hydei TaxID=1337664 RepID=A0ABR1WDF2_9PEZI